MHYFGKFGPMLGKVAIQVKVPVLHDSRIRAKLLLPDGKLFENKMFDLLITKSMYINTLNDHRTLLDWAHQWGREQDELAGRRNARNSVHYETDGDVYLLAFDSKTSDAKSFSADTAATVSPAIGQTSAEQDVSPDRAQRSSAGLSVSVAREFLYRQLYRLPLRRPEELPKMPGLYAVFEPGQDIETAIEPLPASLLRCVKFGMTKGQTIRGRISSQYCGKWHRSAVPRMHIGDALIGQAINNSRDLAGIAARDLADFRLLWNVGGSEGDALKKYPEISSRMRLSKPADVRALESPLESLVSDVVDTWRFVGIPARDEDIDLIEDRANSLLSDLFAFDPPSADWLGLYSSRKSVRARGLWAYDGVQFGRSYRPYTTHPNREGRCNEDGQLISDWLGRFVDLINQATH